MSGTTKMTSSKQKFIFKVQKYKEWEQRGYVSDFTLKVAQKKRHKLARKCKGGASISICKLLRVALPTFLQQKYFFGFELELLRMQPYWFILYQCRAEKGWLVMYLVPLPLMPTLIMTSLIQTATLKMAALTAVFWQLSNVNLVHDVTDTDCHTQNGSTHSCVSTTFKHQFLTNQTMNWLKTDVHMLFFILRSYWLDPWCIFALCLL